MSIACPSLIGEHYPQLCMAVDHYCERTGPGFDAEPVNALSNVAFLLAAGAVWRLQMSHPPKQRARLVRALTVTIVLVGLGSFLFHTVATRWAEWADVLPILLFMLLYFWLTLTVFFGWTDWRKLAALLAYGATTLSIEGAIPPRFLWGGALYLPTVFVMAAVTMALSGKRRPAGRGMLVAIVVFLSSFAARTLDVPLCHDLPLGTHFLWHLLNAGLLYLLVRVVLLHGSAR